MYTAPATPQNVPHASELTDEETTKFIKWRATNCSLFTGRRNSSKLAWRAILKETGLHGKMSTAQANKKWENLKKKYKELKYPLPGIAVKPENWPWFKLMDDAMEGRLEGSAPVVSISSVAINNEDFPHHPKPRKRAIVSDGSEIELVVNVEDLAQADEWNGLERQCDQEEMEQERAQLDSDRAAVESEKGLLERERMVLDRERAALQRELAALDRDRAALEREKASVERERAAVDRDRAQLEKDRAIMLRQREALHRDMGLGTDTSTLNTSVTSTSPLSHCPHTCPAPHLRTSLPALTSLYKTTAPL
uniref:Myb/SANT-like DNA-binding domain-containing protein n=1 Tax=Denticeps clupeoides TaxID=299321 RepID=A0AAY4DJ92_9TELE